MIVPIFGCDDVEACMDFYVNGLGCEVVAEHRGSETDANPAYVTLALSGHHLHLTSFEASRDRHSAAYIYADTAASVDRLYEKIKDRSDIEIRIPPTDQTWGMREIGLTDPGGNIIYVGASLEETPE